jgi:hypothetical protein
MFDIHAENVWFIRIGIGNKWYNNGERIRSCEDLI